MYSFPSFLEQQITPCMELQATRAYAIQKYNNHDDDFIELILL